MGNKIPSYHQQKVLNKLIGNGWYIAFYGSAHYFDPNSQAIIDKPSLKRSTPASMLKAGLLVRVGVYRPKQGAVWYLLKPRDDLRIVEGDAPFEGIVP